MDVSFYHGHLQRLDYSFKVERYDEILSEIRRVNGTPRLSDDDPAHREWGGVSDGWSISMLKTADGIDGVAMAHFGPPLNSPPPSVMQSSSTVRPVHDWHVVSIEKVRYLPGWFANPMYVRVVTVMNDSDEPAIFRGQIEFQSDDGVVQSRAILMYDTNHNPSEAFSAQVPSNPLEAFSVQVPGESEGILTGMPTTDHENQRMVVKLCRVKQTSQDCDSFTDEDGKISRVADRQDRGRDLRGTSQP
jgi:hypothetical protein